MKKKRSKPRASQSVSKKPKRGKKASRKPVKAAARSSSKSMRGIAAMGAPVHLCPLARPRVSLLVRRDIQAVGPLPSLPNETDSFADLGLDPGVRQQIGQQVKNDMRDQGCALKTLSAAAFARFQTVGEMVQAVWEDRS